METHTTHDHSLTALIRELRDETTTLVRQEVALAKTELSEKMSRLVRNAIYIALGGLIAYAALVLLLLAARDMLMVALVNGGISEAVALWLSPLIVGVAVGLVGWGMIAKGKKAVAREGITPEKTIDSIREDSRWARQKLQRT